MFPVIPNNHPESIQEDPTHCAMNPMYFENTGHLGGVTEDDIQRISMTLPKFPVLCYVMLCIFSSIIKLIQLLFQLKMVH